VFHRETASVCNYLEHFVEPNLHIFVVESQCANAAPAEAFVSKRVCFLRAIVNGPVHLDAKGSRMAIEVENEACKHLLPPKSETLECVPSQGLPQSFFRRCWMSAKVLGKRDLLRHHTLWEERWRRLQRSSLFLSGPTVCSAIACH